ncbi:MAG: hypothetical protein MJ233_00925 [Mycoplasmoidaceae bacterium]|nr:hypothetical protein [Mycoplasmoidaceae bacterium]
MEGEQNVQSKIVQLYINPLIFNLEASSEQYTFNANEGFAGNTKDKLIFNTTFGVEGQQVDVTDKTTFTIVDGGDTPAEVLSKIHFNKETGAIE